MVRARCAAIKQIKRRYLDDATVGVTRKGKFGKKDLLGERYRQCNPKGKHISKYMSS